MNRQPARSAASEFRTGWKVVLAAAVGAAVTGAHFHVTGTMMKPLSAAYGWSRGDIGLAVTVATIAMALFHVPVGILVDRWGPKRVLVPGVVLFGLGAALFGFAGPELWTWFAAYTVFSILLVPTAAFVWFAAVVRHFKTALGFALSLCLAGSAILTAITPAIILALVSHYGVRGTYFVLAAGSVALMLPFALWAVPGRAGNEAGEAEHGQVLDRRQRNRILGDFLFWKLALVVLCISVAIGTYSVHYQSMLTDSGLTPGGAAAVALYLAPSMIVSALGSGAMLDRFDPRIPAALIFLLPGITAALLFGYSGDPVRGAAIGLLLGATFGAPVSVISFLAGYYFEPHHFGFVSSAYFGVLGVAIGLGSWLAGLLFDISHDYSSTYVLMIVTGVAAAGLILSIRRRNEPMAA
ncbi:MAG: MFS transporter [Novosphingobium sp.]|nr:MFS transporter [Novosphingobium sp.]